MKRHFRLLVAGFWMVQSLCLWAQTETSSVSGFVLDDKGQAVAGVTVSGGHIYGTYRESTFL